MDELFKYALAECLRQEFECVSIHADTAIAIQHSAKDLVEIAETRCNQSFYFIVFSLPI